MVYSILIVDDEPLVHRVLCRQLEQSKSYRVWTARSGASALTVFERERIDLVITDLVMDKMNGLQLLQEIKKLDAQVPVIIISGCATLDDAINAIHLGAEDFLRKPFEVHEMMEAIQRTLLKVAEVADQRRAIEFISNEDIQLEIPNNYDLLSVVINYIFSHLRARWLLTDEALHGVKVSLYEALMNAFEHGNLEITGEHKSVLMDKGLETWKEFLLTRMKEPAFRNRKIHVQLRITESDLEVKVRDDGPGFDYQSRTGQLDPESLFLCNGRGLILIQHLMDELSFNEKGNEIRMKKRREQPRTSLLPSA